MREDLRSQLLIVAAAAAIFFTNLGVAALWDMDEAIYTTCAREMFLGEDGHRPDWVVPMFNGRMFPEKPPLMFWTMMAGFELLGVNEWGARFFSAVLGVATALAAFHLGRILFNGRVGLWAGLATASTIIFTVSARAATVDMGLTFATTAAFLLFVLAGGTRFLQRGSSQSPKRSGFRGQGSELEGTQTACPEPRTLNPESATGAGDSLNWPYAILMYACIGVAALAKGPVVVLPLAALGFYLLVINSPRPGIPLVLLYGIVVGSMLGECAGMLIGRWVTPLRLAGILPPLAALGWHFSTAVGWRRVCRLAWQMRPLTAIVVVAAVAVPWYVLVVMRTDGRWLREFVLDFNLRPFQQPIQGHGDVSSFGRVSAALVSALFHFFHIPGVLIGFFPWAVFLGPTLVDTVRRVKNVKKGSDPFYRGCMLASCWFSVWFVFWSLCKTKLPHYLLPAYPALALLTACFIDGWLAEPASTARWALRNAWLSIILTGVGLMIALPIVAWIVMPGEAVLGLVGLILVAGGGWCWWNTAQGRHRQAATALALTSVVFLTATFGFAALRVDRHQNAPAIMSALRRDSGQSTEGPVSAPIAAYRFFRESMVYYAGHPVTHCDNPSQLREFLAQSGRGYVITTNDYEHEVAEQFPKGFREVFRQPCFLAPGEIVVLAAAQDHEPPGRE